MTYDDVSNQPDRTLPVWIVHFLVRYIRSNFNYCLSVAVGKGDLNLCKGGREGREGGRGGKGGKEEGRGGKEGGRKAEVLGARYFVRPSSSIEHGNEHHYMKGPCE